MSNDFEKAAREEALHAELKAEQALPEKPADQLNTRAHSAMDKASLAQQAAEAAVDNLKTTAQDDKLSLEKAGLALKEAKEAIFASETARLEAEVGRQHAEVARDMAEVARNVAERARNFSQSEQVKTDLIRQQLVEAKGKADLALQTALLAYEKLEVALIKAKTAQEKAELAEERYKLVIQGSNDGIWDWDADTDEIYWNGHFYQMLGITDRVHQNTQGLLSLVHPDDQERLKTAVQQALAHTHHFEDVFRIKNAQGEYLACKMRGQTILKDGKPIRMAGMITDITAAKRAEDQIQRLKAAAEQANKDKTKVLSFVSHDFKNPLSAMSQFIGIIQGDKNGSLSPQQQEFLGYIYEAVHHLQQMVMGILDKTRLEEGQMVPVIELMELAPLLRELTPLFKAMAHPRNITVVIDVHPSLIHFEADRNHLRQILINLMSNAIKYNQPNQQAILRINPSPDRQWLVIEVQDFGVGMSAESLSNLFANYYRGINLAQINTIEGTGLGLSFVKKLIELQGAPSP